MGALVSLYCKIGYATGFVVFTVLAAISMIIIYRLLMGVFKGSHAGDA